MTEKIPSTASGPINILADPYLAKCLRFSLRSGIKKWSFSRAFHYMSLRALNLEALSPGFPHGASVKRAMLHFQPFIDMEYVAFRVPSKGAFPPGSPRRATIERDAPLPGPSFVHLSKSPVNESSYSFPNGVPMERFARFQSFLLVISRSLL